MVTFEYNGKEYLIPSKIKELLLKYQEEMEMTEIIKVLKSKAYQSEIIKFLESKPYQEGKISDNMLIKAIKGYLGIPANDKWGNGLKILTSEMYTEGLISDSIFKEIVEIKIEQDWTDLNEYYKKGIIKSEHWQLIFDILEKNTNYTIIHNGYYVDKEGMINAILLMLTSEEYAEGKISDETIRLVSTVEDEDNHAKFDTIQQLVLKKRITGSFANDEVITSILKESESVVTKIINNIVWTRAIEPEKRGDYILAVLSLENKKELYDIYVSYRMKRMVCSLDDFAHLFVLYCIGMSQFDIKGSYSRKRQNN